MKITMVAQSIEDGTKLTLTFRSEVQKNAWIEKYGHNYTLKSFKYSNNN